MAAEVPGQDELVAILSAEGAPPSIVLDIGGSADLDGDGLVEASLDDQGQLVLRDV
jgi:hypothetical protein